MGARFRISLNCNSLLILAQFRVLNITNSGSRLSLKLQNGYNADMHYVYILWSKSGNKFYFGYTTDLKKRVENHNNKFSKYTSPYVPWRLVFYCAFDNIHKAKDFEKYLKTGSGKAFAYKRLLTKRKTATE